MEWVASPSGALEASVQAGEDLQVRSGGGELRVIELPELFALDSDLVRFVAWVDEDRVYVAELDRTLGPEGPSEPACRVVHLDTGAVTTPKECITGSFYGLYEVTLHEGVAVALSAGEGHPGIDAYRWTPEEGRGEDLFPEINLYPFGPVEPRWVGDSLVLYSPCRLDLPQPCMTEAGEEREGPVWAWTWREGRWVRRPAPRAFRG